jgi:hypothetical protein
MFHDDRSIKKVLELHAEKREIRNENAGHCD